MGGVSMSSRRLYLVGLAHVLGFGSLTFTFGPFTSRICAITPCEPLARSQNAHGQPTHRVLHMLRVYKSASVSVQVQAGMASLSV
eukprot:2978041-Rhodomonas_salina.4